MRGQPAWPTRKLSAKTDDLVTTDCSFAKIMTTFILIERK
jgi:hypothetical protein